LAGDADELSAAIAEIYDAAVDPTKWKAALGRACDFVGGAQGTMFWQGLTADEVGALHLYNDDPHYTKLYLEKLAPMNPVFPAALFQDIGAVVSFHDHVPPQEEQETAFFKEWVAPQGFTGSLAAVLERDATRFAFLSFPFREGAIDAAARRRMELLVPHFQRSVAIGRLFVQHEVREALLTKAMDGVGEGVFLLGNDRRMVFANATGRRLINEAKVIEARHDRLHSIAAEADRAIGNGMRAIAGGAPIDAQGVTVTLEEAPEARWIAHLLPLGDSARRSVGERHHAVAALFVRNSRAPNWMPLEALAKRHQLTASEIRVVEAALRLSSQEAMADALGISKSTVKTHLNHVYRKCAVKNQSGLIKLIAGLELA
jgi:DNA-binding CsgD family transcriptional regulator